MSKETKIKKPKTGGRTKGTPNKVTATIKAAVSELLSQYYDSGRMIEDFNALDPKDRVMAAERMMPYVMPKMQSIQAELSADVKSSSLDSLLSDLSKP